MSRLLRVAVLSCSFLLLGATGAFAQGPDWRPPSREMPAMPRQSELGGDWLSSRGNWFQGVDAVVGVPASRLQATGEARGGVAQVARFMNGPIPAVVWSDRNGDSRADLIEIFRSGGVIVQLIDADYDGSANVMRIYDASGKLLREERM